MKYTIYSVLCQDTCEPICFKLSIMLDMTQLYSLISVWMILMFTQGHRVMGKLECVQPVCRKIAWSNWNAHDGWVWKGDDCEEVLYSEYGSFEHLLFLFMSLNNWTWFFSFFVVTLIVIKWQLGLGSCLSSVLF